jgi:hypothetical protein
LEHTLHSQVIPDEAHWIPHWALITILLFLHYYCTVIAVLLLHYYCNIFALLLHYYCTLVRLSLLSPTASYSDLVEHLALISHCNHQVFTFIPPFFSFFVCSPAVAASDIVDNPWGVCLEAANVAGIELANTLLGRLQGSRPVTLVGYSMGALVITCALKEMARRSHSRGIVQSVYVTPPPPPSPFRYVAIEHTIFHLFSFQRFKTSACKVF